MPPDLKQIIEEEIISEYTKLDDPAQDRCQVYAQIIEMKLEIESRHRYPVYVDIKRWIKMYFEDYEMQDFGYDSFSIKRYGPLISKLPVDQQISLYNYAANLCRRNDIDCSDISKLLENVKMSLYRKNKRYFRLAMFYLGNHLWFTLLTICISVVILALLLLPASNPDLIFFETNLLHLSNNSFINCILNSLLFFFDFEYSDTLLAPVNTIGAIAYCLFKAMFILLILNYAYQKIADFISKISVEQ